MNFKNLFDQSSPLSQIATAGAGDLRSGNGYLFSEKMELAISAASATQRPLLVTGPAGCGKSALARCSADRLNWRYLERTVNSKMEVTSLLWEMDHLRRLQDAQANQLDDGKLAYVRPGMIWHALDHVTAQNPQLLFETTKQADRETNPAVVLIDEIDKADPDLPNNLLELMGQLRFEVAETGKFVTSQDGIPLIVITSNDERDLPAAFVRRCICLRLQQPDLQKVAQLHFPDDKKLIRRALKLLEENNERRTASASLDASAAEFLDFVQACKELKINSKSEHWEELAELCLIKSQVSAP